MRCRLGVVGPGLGTQKRVPSNGSSMNHFLVDRVACVLCSNAVIQYCCVVQRVLKVDRWRLYSIFPHRLAQI